MEKVQLEIEGLDCATCALKVENALNKCEDIEEANVLFAQGKVSVTLKDGHRFDNDKMKEWQKIIAKVEDVKLSERKALPKTGKFKLTREISILLISALLLGISFISASLWLNVAMVIVFILVGKNVLVKAFNNIRRGEWFDEYFLMSIATIGALLIGDVAEALGVMVFYSIGEMMQDSAINRARETIAGCMKTLPVTALVQRGTTTSEVDPHKVFVGDTLVILPGSMIPLDGVVLKGQSELDLSSLSGESLPVSVKEGSTVVSGSMNLQGKLTVKVTKKYADSTIQKMIELIENAAAKKAPLENFVTKFAKIYTPIVVALAVIVMIIVSIYTQSVLTGIHRALIFLVISCPCALVISIPLGFYAAIGKAGTLGILVKGGGALQKLAEVNEIVMDKTGTLTEGLFAVSSIHSIDHNDEKLLEIAALAESSSTHPLARAVVRAFGKPLDEQRIGSVTETAGLGITAVIDGKTYQLGNDKFAEQKGILLPAALPFGSYIHLSNEEGYLGTIVLNDRVKSESKEAVRNLHAQNLRVSILSGDRIDVAKSVANELNIDEVRGELHPHQKVSELENLRSLGHTVAFVGDGMNDAAALAISDIGIAMGAMGSDLAIETADIVLMNDNPLLISDAVTLSKRTMSVLKQNLVLVLGIKSIVLLLGSLGFASMWLAVFADVGVALLAILNSMRVVNGGHYATDRH